MSKLSAFFDKKKKKVAKATAPPELTQVTEKVEEPVTEDSAEWSLEPQQDAAVSWAAGPASPAANGAAAAATTGGTAEGPLGRSLRVSAVGAYEIESKKDKSWSTMKRLDEEQRRGLQELREQEARELLLQQQLEQGIEPQQDTSPESTQQQQQEATPPKEEENKPWVSTRVLRNLEAGGSLRRARGAPVPSFDGDPDLATAVQLISSKPQQQQQTKKQQQQQRKSPTEPQQDTTASTSPSTKSEDRQQQQQQQGNTSSSSSSSSSSLSDAEGSVAAPAAFTFDVQKFVSFEGLSGAAVPLDGEQVRAKYEARAPWTALAATEA
ncbi:uncharacterized protein EMH_0008580 [Eimeria mitis]|uniref:Uncharacterized protein n=1 Tax=Eimeria mitis TaxID=44415 RepID=U6JTP2_9EIME|nr:uncharacterized protein EMH_0008580 [Eimeria mitis]CDJ27422.1 hypothetical protein, conserved [Eimeria mitis]